MPQTISRPFNRRRFRFSLFSRRPKADNVATLQSRLLSLSVENDLRQGNMIDLDRDNYYAVIYDPRRDVIVEYYEPGVNSHLSRLRKENEDCEEAEKVCRNLIKGYQGHFGEIAFARCRLKEDGVKSAENIYFKP